MIRFQCPLCHSLLQAPDETAGNVVSCGSCKRALRAPAPPPDGTPQRAFPTAPRSPRPAPAVRISPRTSPPRPSRRPPRRQRGPLVLFAALAAALFVLVGLAGSAYYLWGRSRPPLPAVSSGNEPQPREKTPPQKQPVKEAAREKDKPPDKPPPAEDVVQRLLATVNRQREQDKAPPLSLHAEHSQGCLEHARYLARHLPQQPDLDPHDQDATLPGASAAGRAAARAGSVVLSDPGEALSAWLRAPAHRSLLLDPALRSVGIGVAPPVAVFDWVRGHTARAAERGPRDPVVYPAPGQADVPLAFPGNEVPDPLPDATVKLAGYPITATFPAGVRVPDARAWLEDESGKDEAVWFSSPARPANPKFARTQQNTVCLFAREVLRAGARYVVRVEASLGPGEWSRTWTFATHSPAVYKRLIYQRAKDRLNHFREAAGLEPVTFDEGRMRGCGNHAAYLAKHLDRVPNLKVNDESPDLAGYTEEGRAVAEKSIPRFGGGVGPTDAIDWMMASVMNRHIVLNPSMHSMGMGAAMHSPRGWLWVVSLPTTRRQGDGKDPILFPSKGQKDVPIHFGREVQSILPEQPADAIAGYAVTANFFPLRKVHDAKASLADEEGKAVDCWLFTPQRPPPKMDSYRQILLIPKKPLRSATTYAVEMSAEVDGKPWRESWRFTTADLERGRAEVSAALLRRVNEVRALAGLEAVRLEEGLTKGCQLHAEYLVRNLEDPRAQGLGLHDEEPSLPGYTKEGERAGQAGVIAIISDPLDSVEGWMATLYHRIPLLDPRLRRIGYGQARHGLRGWVTVLDAGNGK